MRAKNHKKLRDFTACETALYRRDISVSIADRLAESANIELLAALACRTPAALALAEFAAESLAVADCMRETASDENIYYSTDQINFATGELYDGYGSLVCAVGTRIDPSHQSKQSTRWSRKIKKSYVQLGITDADGSPLVRKDGSLKNFASGVRLRFLTVSMPLLKCSAAQKLLILDAALVKLKKRDVWKNSVVGAYLSEEFTNGEAAYFSWNFHAHALLVSKWLDQELLAAEWTDCVIKACELYNVEFPEFDTKGNPINHLHIWINDVATYAKEKGISLAKAIFEVSKYSCKGSDILNVPTEELAELRRTLHGRRMVESYGIFNNQKGKSEPQKSIEELELEAILFEHNDQSTEPETDNSGDKPLLDTKTQLTPKAAKPKTETLIRIGTRMILEGKRSEWLALLAEKMRKRRAFRREQLAELQPNATFHLLSGRTFSSSDYLCLKTLKLAEPEPLATVVRFSYEQSSFLTAPLARVAPVAVSRVPYDERKSTVLDGYEF